MFFLMLYILALGSILAITSSVITVVRDQFKKVKNWQAALGFAIYGIIFGSFYTTPVCLFFVLNNLKSLISF